MKPTPSSAPASDAMRTRLDTRDARGRFSDYPSLESHQVLAPPHDSSGPFESRLRSFDSFGAVGPRGDLGVTPHYGVSVSPSGEPGALSGVFWEDSDAACAGRAPDGQATTFADSAFASTSFSGVFDMEHCELVESRLAATAPVDIVQSVLRSCEAKPRAGSEYVLDGCEVFDSDFSESVVSARNCVVEGGSYRFDGLHDSSVTSATVSWLGNANGAQFSGVLFPPRSYIGGIEGGYLAEATARQCHFRHSIVTPDHEMSGDFEGSTFEGITVDVKGLRGSLAHASLAGSLVRGVVEARCDGLNVRGADLSEADLSGVTAPDGDPVLWDDGTVLPEGFEPSEHSGAWRWVGPEAAV